MTGAQVSQGLPPERTLSPGYVSALKNSPKLLQALCTQYFKFYDSNLNGMLECTELLALASDLDDFVSARCTADESSLRTSIGAFSARGDDALTPDEFFNWFSSLLRSVPRGQPEAQPPREQMLSDVPLDQSPIHAATPSYMTALAASPNLLLTLSRQWFQRYDVNSNGVLEAPEVLALAKDISSSVAVPLSMSDDELWQSALVFSASRDHLTLEEFSRWFPTMLALAKTSVADIQDCLEK